MEAALRAHQDAHALDEVPGPGALHALSPGAQGQGEAVTGIDPAAEFLLDLAWDNLFERTSAAPGEQYGEYRCKGCGDIVPANKRERHHAAHIRARENAKRKRNDRLREERIRNLAKARAAKEGG